MWSATAQAEKLLEAKNTTGYFGVYLAKPGKPKPYTARVRRGGNDVHLGYFATAEEAALCIARSLEGQAAAAERAAAPPPLTNEEARQQAQTEGLTLRVAANGTGYFGVRLANSGDPKPYLAQARRDGKQVHLGSFATAEEAALCVARSPEGQAAAVERAAAAPPLTSEEARQQAQAEGLTLRRSVRTPGYFGVSHNAHANKGKPWQADTDTDTDFMSAGEDTRWQEGVPGLLRHRRGGGAVRGAVAGGAGGGGGAGCSGAAADERGGAAAGAGRGADPARGRKRDGLLRREPHPSRPAQALSGAGEARWQGRVPGPLRHRRGGRAVRRAVAGGAGGGAEGCSGHAATDERGGGQGPVRQGGGH
eukprot:scaffold92429_cov60-Phaeocystis_antarctica.AAC.2